VRVSSATLRRVARLEAIRDGGPVEADVDRTAWDWYAESCPCGLEPGSCRVHPRARLAQRPPDRPHRIHAYVAGRGAGKTEAGCRWINHRVETGVARSILLIAATAADLRDTVVEGPSGILATAPPWLRPRWQPSMRRLTWPNGAKAVCISGEEPDRARGLNVDTILADELPHWAYPRQTFDLAMLALRCGPDPKAMICTTPKRVDVLVRILGEPTTAVTRESTFANRLHLAAEFIDEITALYKGTRFEQQEIAGRMLDQIEGCWFARFDPEKHVRDLAYIPGQPVIIAIDAGTSRTTAAVIFQTLRVDQYRTRFSVLDDYLAIDLVSAENAEAILDRFQERFGPSVRPDRVYIDPASKARTSIGPAALGEYMRVFGERFVLMSPVGPVTDGLDQIEAMLDRGDLVIDTRCTNLIAAFRNYARESRGGEFLDVPALNQSPWEDSIDALRYGVKGVCPEGRRPAPVFHRVHASRFF
jgi:phage terminase large subunit-like protein